MAANITPEQARAELARRRSQPNRPSITPEQARAELERRRASGPQGSLLSPIVQGATFGFADEIAGGVRGAYRAVTEGLPLSDAYTQERDRSRAMLEDARRNQPIASTVAEIGGSLVPGVGLVKGGLSLAGQAANRGLGLGRTAVGSAVDGSLMGAVYGAGSADENRLAGAKAGAIAGGAVGGAAPFATAGLGNLARRAVSPISSSPERQVLAQTLRGEGVDITAGQATGSRGLRFAEGEIGGNAAADIMERQGEQFTSAALRRAGIDASRATPEVIDAAFTRLGTQFDSLASRNRIPNDPQLLTDLRGLLGEYQQVVPESVRAPIVQGLADDITRQMQAGGISGEAYQSIRSRLDRVARTSARDPELSSTLRGMKEVLDDGMERNMANPADAAAWREVRNQYRNMIVVEQAATGAGENAAAGIISPSQLRNATVNKQGRRNYARGQGDFAELARAGEAIMKPLPDSGTAGRSAVRNLGASLPALIGAGAGGTAGGGMGAVAGALLGAAVPRVAGAAMMSGMGQRYLANQALAGPMSARAQAIANALINSSGASTNARLRAP